MALVHRSKSCRLSSCSSSQIKSSLVPFCKIHFVRGVQLTLRSFRGCAAIHRTLLIVIAPAASPVYLLAQCVVDLLSSVCGLTSTRYVCISYRIKSCLVPFCMPRLICHLRSIRHCPSSEGVCSSIRPVPSPNHPPCLPCTCCLSAIPTSCLVVEWRCRPLILVPLLGR